MDSSLSLFSIPCWYVSNVSIIFYCSMLLYYQSWMFYNHFIVILYHFLVLTYWDSAKCQLLFSACFLHRRKSIPNGVQMQRNFTENFLDQKTPNGPRLRLGGAPRRAQPTRARQEALVGCAHLRCPPDRLFALEIPQYSQNPRGVDEIFIQPPQSPEPPDPS